MSGGYAGRLSDYKNKGVVGLAECFDSERVLLRKLDKFHQLVESSQKIVFLTGAGISTAAGIPDFRGPKGIWTLEDTEKKKEKKKKKAEKERTKSLVADVEYGPESEDSHSDSDSGAGEKTATTTPAKRRRDDSDCSAVPEKRTKDNDNASAPAASDLFKPLPPTLTHVALAKLISLGKAQFIVTQNVDGMHLRSGVPRDKLSILHGDCFTEKCEKCGHEYFRNFDIGGVSFKPTGRLCELKGCEGILRDTILDWEDALPEEDFENAEEMCSNADLVVALGTSLRIVPAGTLPLKAKAFVIVNLQKTPYDSKAALVINAKVDRVMEDLMLHLGVDMDI